MVIASKYPILNEFYGKFLFQEQKVFENYQIRFTFLLRNHSRYVFPTKGMKQ